MCLYMSFHMSMRMSQVSDAVRLAPEIAAGDEGSIRELLALGFWRDLLAVPQSTEEAEVLNWQTEVERLEAEAEEALCRADAAETADEPEAAAGQRAEAERLLALADAARRRADGGSRRC